MNRRIKSLPSLTLIENVLEYKHAPIKRKTRPERNNNFMLMLSVFYAMVLIIIGIALAITNAIAHDITESYYEAFNLFLYLASVFFLFYMYVTSSREKCCDETCNNQDCSRNFTVHKTNIRYGSFYFRIGLIGFGICSIIRSSLKFGQYFEMNPSCSSLTKAVIPASRIVFVLSQILFIFSNNNFQNIRKRRLISKFGLMHLLATNVCEWISEIVKEAEYDIHKSIIKVHGNETFEINRVFVNSKGFQRAILFFSNRELCYQSNNIFRAIYLKFGVYLTSFTVEHSILSAVILVLIWKTCSCSTVATGPSAASGSAKAIYVRSHSQFSVDCDRAHKGLFGGILVLTATIISLIMFFELVERRELRSVAVLQVNIWEAVLFWTGTMAVVFCLIALRDVNFAKIKGGLELEHLLILVAQFGVYMYFLFQIIGGMQMGYRREHQGDVMRVLTPISGLVESSCQTAFILGASRKKCTTQDEIKRKPGRQFVMFLLVTNLSLWIVNRLKDNRSVSHPFHMDFYGVLAWNVITHVTMPLVVIYRFQSMICFYEIWKHVYKARSLPERTMKT